MKKKDADKKGIKVDKIDLEVDPNSLPKLKIEGTDEDRQKFREAMDKFMNEPGRREELEQLTIKLSRGMESVMTKKPFLRPGDLVKLNPDLLGDMLCPDHFEDIYEVESANVIIAWVDGKVSKTAHYTITLQGSKETWGMVHTDWFKENCLIPYKLKKSED